MLNPKAKNTLSQESFCALIFVSVVISWCVFFTVFFEPLPSLNRSMSALAFAFIQVTLTATFAYFLYNNFRKPQNAVLISLLPQLLYYGISVRNIMGLLIGAVCIALLYVAMTVYIFEKARRKDIIEKLSYAQRCLFLQYIFEKELKRLEVRMTVQLVPSRLPVGTLACYCPAAGAVMVNKHLLLEEKIKTIELIGIVAHEAMHVAQVSALLSIDLDSYAAMTPEERWVARQIRQEFLDYKTAEQHGYEAYCAQVIEVQAKSCE